MICKVKWTVVLRVGFVVAGVYSLPLFLIPLSLSVGVNIGNATGITVALLLIGYGLLFTIINKGIKAGLKHRMWRYFIYLAGLVAGTIVVLVIILTSLMLSAMAKEPKGHETLVVLGCRVYGEAPSLSLRERLDAALVYLEEHPEVYCVVSGGQGDGENISEAECMYRYLTDRGIDGARIFKEDASTTTRENLEFSLALIKEKGLSQEIAIATSEYHQYRAGLVAKELGLSSAAVCGKTASWLLPTFYIRELYGILYQWVF